MKHASYDPKEIEPKWQKYWEEKGSFHAKTGSKKKKFYALVEFPYPSGDGLHTGHVRGYTAMDVIARKRRLEGFETLYPIGWDAFGLPTENFAIKHGIHPKEVTKKNTDNFRRQMQTLGFSFDWSREINTTDPEYYKWTQWIFLQLFKKGLAYKQKMEINWCPSCKIGLANEEAQGGVCERCGGPTEKREKEQWMLAITKYADRLDKDLDSVNYLDKIKIQQRNWIGRSEGSLVKFRIKEQGAGNRERGAGNNFIEVFTTRVDTIFGCTYVVVAPEHESIKRYEARITNYGEVKKYLDQVKKKTEQDRLDATKEKTGVKLDGIEAVNPFTGESVPIFVADYVLGNYGTGAVMAVPAHDERDWEFAKRHGLLIRESVIQQVSPRKEGAVFRRGAYGLIFNEKGDVLLQFYRKSKGWYLPGGGLEEKENEREGLIREIEEETGYFDFSIEEKVGTIEDNFFSPIRGEERCLVASVYKVILHSHKNRGATIDKVERNFGMENKWTSLVESRKRLHETSIAQGLFKIIERFPNQKEFCFIDDGVLIDSGEFSGLESKEAREKMTAWLEKEGLGQKQTNYKLRDWVFSRQRYWGEPIPLVKCDRCGIAEVKTKLSINFYNHDAWSRLLSGEKTIETRAINPEEPKRYFGDVAIGDMVKFVHKKTNEEKVFRVRNVYRFSGFQELLERSDLHEKILSKKYSSLKHLRDTYDALSPGYAEKIDENGLVGWEVELVDCGKWIPLPEKDLPLELPKVESYVPTETGESPLAAMEEWVATTCPVCGGPARRETDTMPNWAGSSWYFLRYTDPKNDQALASKEALDYWMRPPARNASASADAGGVDWYNGGMEHTTLHLLYSRFWHKFLYDIGVVPTAEPYAKRTSHGLILAEGGVKMSKSKGNVVNPDDIVRRFGADTLRVYEMFMGPFDQNVAWSTESISGSRRFLEKVWSLRLKIKNQTSKLQVKNKNLQTLLHQTIKKVSEDIEAMRFNTAISALMILVNEMEKEDSISREDFETLLLLFSPFAPHIAEELWNLAGNDTSIAFAKWQEANPKYLVADEVEIVVQVNGKLRARLRVAAGSSQEEAESAARRDALVVKHLEGKEIRKTIFVQDRLVNFVV